MTELFETSREINRFLAAGVFLWLAYRTTRAWPAEWAKPDHVWHYRALLLAGSGFLLATTYGAFLHTQAHTAPSATSAANLLICLFVAGICAKWPKPRAMRKDEP